MKINYSNLTFVLYILIMVGLIFHVVWNHKSTNKEEIKIEQVTIKDTLSFKDSLLNKIFEMRLEHPYIVYSQAIIESGNFSSVIFRENNNLFGMKMPERRVTIAIGISRGHAVYSSWRDCLIDYALYQSAYMRGLSEDEYFARLNRSYAEDVDYENKLRAIKNNFKR